MGVNGQRLWEETPHEVLLCHFGGPTMEQEVEPFLQRLFADPFIIRAPLPQSLRLRLARRIARKRWPAVNEHYKMIGYSPINNYTNAQAMHLEGLLRTVRPNSRVRVVNRYTPPFAEDVLRDIDIGRSRLFVVTLYPHFSHSTTASALRDVDLALNRLFGEHTIASTRVFSWWYQPRYLELGWEVLREGLETALAAEGPVSVVFSAHGLPKRYADRGDPYPHDIRAHFATLRRRGEIWLESIGAASRVNWDLSFQSRVGPVEWLRPYTDQLIEQRGRERGGQLLLVPISFVSDHIETLHEMEIMYRDLALRSGFGGYHRVRTPNEDPRLARVLCDALLGHGF